MRIIRWIVGSLILFFDWITTPKGVVRAADAQNQIDRDAQMLTLYQYKSCPFCVKVRRSMKRQSLKIETRDAKRCDTARNELLEGGGRLKVPCLKVVDKQGDIQWMYESSDIINFLEDRFQAEAA